MQRPRVVVLLLCVSALPASALGGSESGERWWRDEQREDYWARPCEYKLESKPGEFKREIKCTDGVGATWRGEWKEEFWDGPCKVKIEASREVFKEEVKCEGGR